MGKTRKTNFQKSRIKIKFKKIKKDEYISLHSIHSIRDIEKTTGHPRQRSILLKEQIKKKQFKHTTEKTFCTKNGQKIFKTVFMFQKLNATK